MSALNTQEFDWQQKYKERITPVSSAMKLIKPGAHIFIGTGCAQPLHLVKAMVEHAADIFDAHIIHLMTVGEAPYLAEKLRDKFKMSTFFISDNVREAVAQGHGDYTPIFLSEVPQEFEEGRIPIDVALVQVSPPDQRGLCSLGVSVDIVKSAVANAKYVIAQVNNNMPRTLGDAFVHVNQIDAMVPHDEALVEVAPVKIDETLRRIGENVARLIEDGSTIECGIGMVPQAVAEFLKTKKDLGIHTEMFGDWIIDLIESGAVNCKKKTVNRGKAVASFCIGTKRLYDYVNNNAFFEFRPTEYVNDPYVISRHDKMVAINVGLEIDLTGQVVADSIGTQFYSGVGGQVDFMRGAARSRDGKAIIAMPSTAKDGTVSRIVPTLSQGSGVVSTRADVHYVVTEYGIAYLHGKSIRERAMALVNIAHPNFRRELIQAAKKLNYVYADQIELAWEKVRYPEELERFESLRDGSQVFFRPVRPTDESKLAEMLYSLSADSVHNRFFTYTMAFPHKNVQQLTNVDYTQNLAIVGSVPGPVEDEIVAIAQYFLNPAKQTAEVAFLVLDEWQQRGLGTRLLEHLVTIARQRGITRFDAKVIPQNKAMLSVFQNCGLPMKKDFDGESYSISLDLRQPAKA